MQATLVEAAMINATDPLASQKTVTGQTREAMLIRAMMVHNGNFTQKAADGGWRYETAFSDGYFYFRASTD